MTPRTVTRQAPLSLGFFRQEYWSGLPFPPPEDLPDPGIKPTSPVSPVLQADSLSAEPLRYLITKVNVLSSLSSILLVKQISQI